MDPKLANRTHRFVQRYCRGLRGGTAPDLLIDKVEVGELARDGAGALLAGGGFLLLGQEVAPGEPRLLFPVLGAGASCRRRAGASGAIRFRFRRR